MGNFVWRAETILAEFERHAPDLAARARSAVAGDSSLSFDAYYRELPESLCQSIDYAIMEKARSIRAVPCRVPWDDVGTWTAVRRLREKDLDSEGNLALIRHLPIGTKNTLVAGTDSEEGIVVTVGVEGLVIIRDGEKVLVVSEEAVEQLKEVVPALKDAGLERLV
jgi:mannose-1-phosphate guanylyltransferase